MKSFFDKDDITGLHFVCKLPCGEGCIFVGIFLAINLFHFQFHGFFTAKCVEIADFAPTKSHDADRVEFVPFACIVTGRVDPIPNGIHILVADGRAWSFGRSNTGEYIILKREIKSVSGCELLAAFAHTVRFVACLSIVIGDVFVNGSKCVQKSLRTIIPTYIPEKAHSDFNITPAGKFATIHHISEKPQGHFMRCSAKVGDSAGHRI